MNITVTPPGITRALSIGLVAIDPPRVEIPTLNLSLVNVWVHAHVIPDGTNEPSITNDGTYAVADASGSSITGTGEGIGILNFLLARVIRKPGYTGAITAQVIRLTCTPSLSCSANATTDVITCGDPHGLRAGDAVKFISGTMPGNITANTEYFVIASGLTELAFKVSATRGGSALDISSAGASVIYTPGEIEIARINVAAVAAGTNDPQADPVIYASEFGTRRFSVSDTYPLQLRLSDKAAAANLQIYVQAAGQN